jgi:endonuclease/exonuclease/phosphatase family metal-dependent hydrolase
MTKLRLFIALLIIVGASYLLYEGNITGHITQERPTLRIASWNIENFGQKKATDPDVMGKIANVLQDYDIIALQEISNVDEKIDVSCDRNADACPGPKCGLIENSVRSALAQNGRNYDVIMSPQVKDERYAFVFNPAKVQLIDKPYLVVDTGESLPFCNTKQNNTGLMLRQPFVASFRSGNFDFSLMTVHTSPSQNVEEIEGLTTFYEMAKDNTILLGDINADCNYLRDDQAQRLRRYLWLMPDALDTTVSKTDCTYDQVIIKDALRDRFTGSRGVDPRVSDDMSDHYLVWAHFYSD